MAVDPEYIEEVTDEQPDYETVMEQFGIEASYEKSGNGLDMDEYMQTYLREMYDGDINQGRPVVSDIYTVEFKDKNTGEVNVNHKIDLVIFDDSYEDEKEAFIYPINLNSDNIDFEKNIVKNVNSASGLYALAMGMMELEAPKISKAFNKLDVVGIKQLQKQVAKYDDLTVKTVEKSFKSKEEETYYNSFRITDGKK